MFIVEIVLLVLILAAAIALTIAVLFQKNKTPGLSGAISGGASDTYYGQGKTQSREKKLNRLTIGLSIFFAFVVIAFCVIQPFTVKYDYGNPEDYYNAPESSTTEAPESSTAAPESSTTEAPESSTAAPESTTAPESTETPESTEAPDTSADPQA